MVRADINRSSCVCAQGGVPKQGRGVGGGVASPKHLIFGHEAKRGRLQCFSRAMGSRAADELAIGKGGTGGTGWLGLLFLRLQPVSGVNAKL